MNELSVLDEETAENEVTLLQLLDAGELSLDNFLYIVQGTGRDRDRKLILRKLRDFLQNHFETIKIDARGGSVSLSGDTLIFTDRSGNYVKVGFSGGIEIKNGSFVFTLNGDGMKVQSINVEEDVVVKGDIGAKDVTTDSATHNNLNVNKKITTESIDVLDFIAFEKKQNFFKGFNAYNSDLHNPVIHGGEVSTNEKFLIKGFTTGQSGLVTPTIIFITEDTRLQDIVNGNSDKGTRVIVCNRSKLRKNLSFATDADGFVVLSINSNCCTELICVDKDLGYWCPMSSEASMSRSVV